MLVLLLGLLACVFAAKPNPKVAKDKLKAKKPLPAAKKPSPRALGNDTDALTIPGSGGSLGNDTLGLNITDEVEGDGANDTLSVDLTDTLEDNLNGKDSNETEVDTKKKAPFDPFTLKKTGLKASKKSKRNSPDKKTKASVVPIKKDKAKAKAKGKRGQRSLDMG